MSRFEKMHPLFQTAFFAASLIIPICVNHPLFSFASLIGAVAYSFVRNGKKAFKTLLNSLIVTALVAIFNMLFAHYGRDVLFKIGNTDFTLEALFFGVNQGVVLSSVFIWFTFSGRIIDSERITYLFRFAPKTALTFSIILGFIPRFLKKLEDIKTARLALCGGRSGEGIKYRLKTALNDFSALVSYSLEAGIITADSMSARNYNPKAVSPKRFKLSLSDAVWCSVTLIVFAYIIAVKLSGYIVFVFEPAIYSEKLSVPALCVFLIFELSVSIIDLTENYKWKKSSVKA